MLGSVTADYIISQLKVMGNLDSLGVMAQITL